MKKLDTDKIVLNEYEANTLKEILNLLTRDTFLNFVKKTEKAGIKFESYSEREDLDFLMWTCDAETKEHLYYKSLYLLNELNSIED